MTNYFSLAEIFKAYRKAKSDAFYDKDSYCAIDFLKYEANLERNLKSLLGKLSDPGIPWFQLAKNVGSVAFVPKSLDAPVPPDKREVQYATLDPLEDWELLARRHKSPLKADFRQTMVPTVDFQVLSSLWLIKVGHKFDQSVDKRLSFAHNLRRVGGSGPIAEDSPSLFVPYIGGYKSWRSRGLQAMRAALREEKSIVAMTMDVKRFYHNASPEFLLRPEFLKRNLISLSAQDKDFTKGLVSAINAWYRGTPDWEQRKEGSLPVGLSASRVISNALLAQFDRVLNERLGAIYYGRYADDIFLVVERPEGIATGDEFVRWLRSKMEGWLVLEREDGGYGLRLSLPYAKDSDILFSRKKQKIFFLSGEHGFDLLDQISDKIEEQSSMFRRLPEIPSSESKMVARALLATPDARLEVDSLRKAEGVSIRRFGFSMLLSDIEAYARDLDPADWKQMRLRFYGLVQRYVLTPSGLFDYVAYIHRVFGLMIACRDYSQADKFLDKIDRVALLLRETTTAGSDSATEFASALTQYKRGFLQSALQASTVEKFRINDAFLRVLRRVSTKSTPRTKSVVKAMSIGLLKSDLGRRPYHDYWFTDRRIERSQPALPADFGVRRTVALTKKFRSKIHGIRAPYWPAVAFPTRPIPLWSICISAPNLMAQAGGLQEVVQATRGAQVNPRRQAHRFIWADDDGTHMHDVPGKSKSALRFGLSSYIALESDWAAAVKGSPSYRLERYDRLHRLINRMVDHDDSLDYVAFPEACMPLRWALSIAYRLGQRGVSFITGIESREGPQGYSNEALVSLVSDFYGRRGAISFLQRKMELAHRESRECAGLTFSKPGPVLGRPIYMHGGFCFGVLICSDLTSIANRSHFQGKVDALFVLEWNPDVSTFEFLVESTAHDLHAAIIQVNNREFGDSRIRVPFKASHRRDLVQVRGGDSDFFVTARIDFGELRDFQRSGDGEDYKPLPIGFQMSDFRRSSKADGGW